MAEKSLSKTWVLLALSDACTQRFKLLTGGLLGERALEPLGNLMGSALALGLGAAQPCSPTFVEIECTSFGVEE